MTLATDIKMFSTFQGIIQRHSLCKLYLTTFTFPTTHSSFKYCQRILVLFDRITGLLFSENSQIFEDDSMITSLHMSEKIRPSKNHSQIFYFSFTHFYNFKHLRSVTLNCKTHQLLYFLFCLNSLIVKVVLNQTIRVDVMIILPIFKFGDQTIELFD